MYDLRGESVNQLKGETSGKFSVELEFFDALKEPVNLIVLAQFDSVFEIDKTYHVDLYQ